MPPREPRGLYLKREYFSDFEFQTKLSPAERECYMGIWQLADDAGWLEWNPGQIASHVYRFEGRDGAAHLELHAAALVATGRLKIMACGHAQLPRGAGHLRPGRPSFSNPIEESHQKDCKRSRKKRNDSLTSPHHTSPHLTIPNPQLPASGRARRNGAPPRTGPASLKSIIGEFDEIVAPQAASKKS